MAAGLIGGQVPDPGELGFRFAVVATGHIALPQGEAVRHAGIRAHRLFVLGHRFRVFALVVIDVAQGDAYVGTGGIPLDGPLVGVDGLVVVALLGIGLAQGVVDIRHLAGVGGQGDGPLVLPDGPVVVPLGEAGQTVVEGIRGQGFQLRGGRAGVGEEARRGKQVHGGHGAILQSRPRLRGAHPPRRRPCLLHLNGIPVECLNVRARGDRRSACPFPRDPARPDAQLVGWVDPRPFHVAHASRALFLVAFKTGGIR